MTVTPKNLFEGQFAPGSATTLYTAPLSTHTIIDKFTACNISGGSVNLTVYLVPSGGTAGTSNAVLSAFPIASGATLDLTQIQNQILNAGDFISVLAGSASSITVRGSGREVAL